VNKADLILLSPYGEKNIITMDIHNPYEEALAIKDGKIFAMSSIAEMKEFKGPKTEVIELKNKMAMPGLIDAHVHFITVGTNMLGINLKGKDIKSIEDIKHKVKERATVTPFGKWIRGWGYDHTKLVENRHPTRFDLDEASPDKPVILTRTCGHIAVANSKALELAGIKDDALDPPGGKFGRSDGKINGVLYETAQDAVLKASAYTLEEYKEGVKIADREFLSCGVTSVNDEGMGGRLGMRALVEAVMSHEINIRICASAASILGDKSGDYFLETGLITGFGNDRICLGPYKVMVDGGSSGPTCATRQPYASDPNNTGILYYSQEELDDLIEKAHARGFQVSAHCVGDRAIEMMLNAIEKAFEKHPRKTTKGLRPRIEHCAICPPDLISRIKKLGVVPIAQPIFFYEFGDGYLRNYGLQRTEHMFPMKSFNQNGIIAAMSTDCPVTTLNPFMNIYEAVTRKTMNGQSCGQTECITVEEALRAYTFGSAYASFQEDVKGSLEIGKLGDVVVLPKNILVADIEDVKNMKIDATIVGGNVVYQRS